MAKKQFVAEVTFKASGEVPEGAILVTADNVGLYPSIPHSEDLEILKKHYENYLNKKVSAEDVGKMADFVLENNLFEFGSKFYKQISGTAIGTKFAPPYACIFWATLKQNFQDARYKTLAFAEIY